MTRPSTLFSPAAPLTTPPVKAIELTKELAEIRNRLLRILHTRNKSEMAAVFQKILADNMLIDLADFAEYCLKNDSSINRLCYGLITHPFLDEFWEDMVLKTTKGLRKIAAVVVHPNFIHQDDWPYQEEHRLYKTKSEYLFNLLVGVLRASQAKITTTMRSMVKESLAALEDSAAAALSKLHPPENIITTKALKFCYFENRPRHEDTYFRTLLLYLYLELRVILEEKAKGEKAFIEMVEDPSTVTLVGTPSADSDLEARALSAAASAAPSHPRMIHLPVMEEALYTLDTIRTDCPEGYGHFVTLAAALHEEVGYEAGYKGLVSHLTNYCKVDSDINGTQTQGGSFLLLAFRFYRQNNNVLGNLFLDYVIDNTLTFGALVALKNTLDLMQLESLSDQEALDVVQYALAHLVKRYNEAEAKVKTPGAVFNNQLDTLLLIYHLHQKRALYCGKLVQQTKRSLVQKWEKIVGTRAPTRPEWEAVMTKLDPAVRERLKKLSWRTVVLHHWDEIATSTSPARNEWRTMVILATPTHAEWERLADELDSEGAGELYKLKLNQKYSEDAADGYLGIAKTLAKSPEENTLITHFTDLSAAPNPSHSRIESYASYYSAFNLSTLEEPSFKKSLSYIAKLENSLDKGSVSKAACRLASILIFMRMLNSPLSKDAQLIINKRPEEEQKLIYRSLIKDLSAIYDSNLLGKGHCIPRIIQQIYAEKLQLVAEAAVWHEKATRDNAEALRGLSELGINAEHKKLANPKHSCPLSRLLDTAQIVALRHFTRSVFSLTQASLTDQLSGLADDLMGSYRVSLKKGVEVNNFYCIDRSVKYKLEELRKITSSFDGSHSETDKARLDTLVDELLELGTHATNHHGAIGTMLCAEIHMQLAESSYIHYKILKPSSAKGGVKLFDGPALPDPYQIAALQLRSKAVRYYVVAELLYQDEAKARFYNAFHGILPDEIDRLGSIASRFHPQSLDAIGRRKRFEISRIPLDSDSIRALSLLAGRKDSSSDEASHEALKFCITPH